MDILSTENFEKDYKKCSKEELRRIRELIDDIKADTFPGKRLHHLKNTYSFRIGNKRLIYNVEGGKAILLMLKSREGIYDYLR